MYKDWIKFMKKIFVLFAVCMGAAPLAGAWGLQLGISDQSALLFNYLGQKQVEQPVCVRTYADGEYFSGLPADSRISEEQLIAEMENGLNYWFSAARQFITASGRVDEFADFLAVIPEHISLKQMPDCTAAHTLTLLYSPREWYIQVKRAKEQPAVVSHKAHYTVPRVRVSDEKAWTETSRRGATVHLYERLDLINLKQVLAHEAGHLLGLTDQYGFMSYLIPGENTHRYFSYLNVSGSRTAALNQSLLVKKPASLMGAPRYHAAALKQMWADDIDGFINAVDYVEIYHKNVLSPRVVNGWKSFSLVREQVGYALGMPFKYQQGKQPAEFLAHVQTYTSQVSGLSMEDIKILQQMYQQNEDVSPLYAHITPEAVHSWHADEITQREAAVQLTQAVHLTPWQGIQIKAQEKPALKATLPDFIVPVAQANTSTQQANPTLALSTRTLEEDDCNFYLIVTDKELQWFYKTYAVTLNSAIRKQKHGEKLTKKEVRLLKWHTQLKENQRKTEKCQPELAQNVQE